MIAREDLRIATQVVIALVFVAHVGLTGYYVRRARRHRTQEGETRGTMERIWGGPDFGRREDFTEEGWTYRNRAIAISIGALIAFLLLASTLTTLSEG